MKSGNRTLTFDTPPPQHVTRFHPPYRKANSKWAIRATGNQRVGGDGVKAMDFDTRTVMLKLESGGSDHVAIGAHGGTIGKDGWTHYINERGVRVKLTFRQRRMSYQAFINWRGGDRKALHSLRRAKVPGDHPITHYEAMQYAEGEGVVLTPELKSLNFAAPAVADRLVNNCRKRDYPCWTMALLSMKEADGKCEAIIEAGGHFSLIFGKFRHLARGKNKIASWGVKPTRIWGPITARQWLRA